MNNRQLRHFLEITCDRIESLAAHYQMIIRITGGRAEAGNIRFFYTPELGFPIEFQESLSGFLHAPVRFGFGFIEVCGAIPTPKPVLDTIQYNISEAL